MIQEFYIPDFIKELAIAVSTALLPTIGRPVFFDYGHYVEVTKNLEQKAKRRLVADKKKQPLIWLVMDYDEEEWSQKVNSANVDLLLPDLQILITTDTEHNYTMDQRRDRSYLPVLYPIYHELFNQITLSKKVFFQHDKMHKKTDRPYWGIQSEGNGIANLFNDRIDALQIRGLKLRVKKNCRA